MKKKVNIIDCFHCPFHGYEEFHSKCKHPQWEEDNQFIILDNRNIPDECPLKIENIEIEYSAEDFQDHGSLNLKKNFVDEIVKEDIRIDGILMQYNDDEDQTVRKGQYLINFTSKKWK